ncbi:hypothetical protein TNCV_499371 [Trichonephila clavipes]|nr:hypothetical protein TNCV_499371 [Trichonephila clavipes]
MFSANSIQQVLYNCKEFCFIDRSLGNNFVAALRMITQNCMCKTYTVVSTPSAVIRMVNQRSFTIGCYTLSTIAVFREVYGLFES